MENWGPYITLPSIGRWLIGLRIAKGWTQEELANRLGVSQAQVSRDENNEYHGISVEKAQKILDVFNARFSMEIEDPLSFDERSELEYA
ncbi:MAG: helix-turn-helix transcriptional regulator [Balneolaceae bacterium]|nr:helix-turn-helix transcriptional regulator [Balneolaceae bacterium]